MSPDAEKAACELLAFYLEAGVDTPMGEKPVDRFAAPSDISPPAERGRSAGEAHRVAVAEAHDPSPDHRSLPSGGATRRPVGRSDPPFSREGTLSSSPAAPPSPDAAALSARDAAQSAKNLDELRVALESF